MLTPDKTSLKIAIVDDEKELADICSKVLVKIGYSSPAVFNDGTSLIRSMMNDKQSYDVILMDYRMPEMNGIEAAKILMRYKPQTKIVMTTGYDFVRQQAADLGIPFLQKPFTMKQLAECLDNLKLEKYPVLG